MHLMHPCKTTAPATLNVCDRVSLFRSFFLFPRGQVTAPDLRPHAQFKLAAFALSPLPVRVSARPILDQTGPTARLSDVVEQHLYINDRPNSTVSQPSSLTLTGVSPPAPPRHHDHDYEAHTLKTIGPSLSYNQKTMSRAVGAVLGPKWASVLSVSLSSSPRHKGLFRPAGLMGPPFVMGLLKGRDTTLDVSPK